jgi:2'-hydroxyisoflavone reductase
VQEKKVNDRRRPSRRQFLGASIAGGAALSSIASIVSSALGAAGGASLSSLASCRSSGGGDLALKPRKILILGGTGFLGPKTVEAALARGHTVTVFNRGKTEKRRPLGFENVEHLYGNRDPNLPADDARGPDGKLLHPDAQPRGLEQLVGREFDAVIDNSGYYTRHVKASAELLAPKCGRYVYVSSISAYKENKKVGADESSELATLADPNVEDMGPGFQNYGGLKAACERVAQVAFPGRAAIVRPGYIVGPGDPTDRFTYWPVRIDRGGEVLAPGTPDDPLQWIDVRDLGEWIVRLVEDQTVGVFNAIGPTQPARWGDVLGSCVAHAHDKATLTWVDADFVEKAGAGGEDGSFPIWIAPRGDYAGFHRWSNERAKAAGLKFRSIDDTVAALLAWFPKDVELRRVNTQKILDEAKSKGQPPPAMPDPALLRAGPKPEFEAKLLADWKAAHAASSAPTAPSSAPAKKSG